MLINLNIEIHIYKISVKNNILKNIIFKIRLCIQIISKPFCLILL